LKHLKTGSLLYKEKNKSKDLKVEMLLNSSLTGRSPAIGGAHVWGACGRPDCDRDRPDFTSKKAILRKVAFFISA